MLSRLLDKKTWLYLFAFCAVLVESFSNVFMKLAGRYEFLSSSYILFFACAVFVMGVYAVMWQLLLEKLPLTTAYLRKGASYVFLFIWARVLFLEKISTWQIVGAIIIIIGMVVSMSDDR